MMVDYSSWNEVDLRNAIIKNGNDRDAMRSIAKAMTMELDRRAAQQQMEAATANLPKEIRDNVMAALAGKKK